MKKWKTKIIIKVKINEANIPQALIMVELVEKLSKEEMELVHGALKFDDTVIRSVMTPRTKMFSLNSKMLLFVGKILKKQMLQLIRTKV